MSNLNTIVYQNIGEILSSVKLTNGLQVYIIEKPEFKESSCVLMTKFGSIDTIFTVRKQLKNYPLGIAHFLEHKLFEMEKGEDASLVFTDMGADCNAFTSYSKTCYYFSTSDRLLDNLAHLQDFVSNLHLTEESVEKEKEIICQEIDMYQDDPDYRLYQGILSCLYPESVLATDIAGTRDSVTAISKKMLQDNYRYFYHPEFMTLVIVGDINRKVVLDAIKEKQNTLSYKRVIKANREAITYLPVLKNKSISMPVNLPKLAVGFRGQKLEDRTSLLRQYIGLKLYFSLLLGWTSDTYQNWYELGSINDSFTIEIEVHKEFQFVIFYLDTLEPITMSNKIRQFLKREAHNEFNDDAYFNSLKKEFYGEFLRSLDSIEHLSLQFVNYLTDDETYYDIPNLIQTLSIDEVIKIGRKFLEQSDVTDFIIFPK